MPSLVRHLVLASAGGVLIWLAGCGTEPAADSGEPAVSIADQVAQRDAERDAAKQHADQAAADAERERLANEAPSDVTTSDFKRGSKLKQGNRYVAALGGALAKGEEVQLDNIKYNLRIHGEAQGYPKSNEEFMRLVKSWGITLPPLQGPYEYWYNAEERKLLKRPIPQADSDGNADGPDPGSATRE